MQAPVLFSVPSAAWKRGLTHLTPMPHFRILEGSPSNTVPVAGDELTMTVQGSCQISLASYGANLPLNYHGRSISYCSVGPKWVKLFFLLVDRSASVGEGDTVVIGFAHRHFLFNFLLLFLFLVVVAKCRVLKGVRLKCTY